MNTEKKTRIIFYLLSLSMISVFYSGCAGKQQVHVEDLGISIPETWKAPFPQIEKISGDWWSVYDDSTLNNFITQLKTESPDLKTLVQNHKLAIQNAKLGGASIFPSINISSRADTNVQNLSGFGFADSFFNQNDSGDSSETSNQSSDGVLTFGNKNFGLGVNLQWEVDIWGRLMNSRKAVYKDYESMAHDLSYLQFSILIRAAKLYFNAREAASQLKLSQESYTSLVEIRNLVKERYEKGLRSSLDFRLAETSVATSIVSIENSKNVLKSLNRQIEILIGDYPSGIFIKEPSLPTMLPSIPIGMPASVIQRRPDIRSLIYKMESAGHRVAQSKRDLLPGVTINGTVGTSTQEIEKIFDEDYGVWNLGMSVTAPIFNGGRLRSIKKIQEANYENSKQDLIRGILKAFSEIEQFLDQNRSLDIQIEALNAAVKQSKDAYELSKERYDKGVTTLESVLNSQRQYNSIRSQQLTIRRLSIENRLSLVLAMGGEIKS